jgi:hypothetical protein
MKIEIFKLLIENINKLNPLDFIIIFVLFALVVFNCYYFFRWIYRDVFESQEKSLQIKNGIISDLEKKSTLIEQKKQMIEGHMNSISRYALFLKSELEKVHHEKNKTEEELNLLKRNASKLLYTIVLLCFATSILEMFKNWREFIVEAMKLADEGKIPTNEKALHYLVRIRDIEERVIEAMLTVDSLVPGIPEEGLQKLTTTKFPVPELAKFDLKSVFQELKEMNDEMAKSYLKILGDHKKPSES